MRHSITLHPDPERETPVGRTDSYIDAQQAVDAVEALIAAAAEESEARADYNRALMGFAPNQAEEDAARERFVVARVALFDAKVAARLAARGVSS